MATIPYPKTWVAGEILTAADLNAQFAAVTSITDIAGGNIATGTLTGNQLATGSVTNTQLAGGAPITSLTTVAVTAPGGPVSNTETTVATLGAFTPKSGGKVLLIANVAAFYTSVGSNKNITFKWQKDNVDIGATASMISNTDAAATVIPLPISMQYVDSPTAVSHTYRLRVVTDDAATSVNWTTSGSLIAIEF